MTDDPVIELEVPFAPLPDRAAFEPPAAERLFPVQTSEEEPPFAPTAPVPTVTVTELPPAIG